MQPVDMDFGTVKTIGKQQRKTENGDSEDGKINKTLPFTHPRQTKQNMHVKEDVQHNPVRPDHASSHKDHALQIHLPQETNSKDDH